MIMIVMNSLLRLKELYTSTRPTCDFCVEVRHRHTSDSVRERDQRLASANPVTIHTEFVVRAATEQESEREEEREGGMERAIDGLSRARIIRAGVQMAK